VVGTTVWDGFAAFKVAGGEKRNGFEVRVTRKKRVFNREANAFVFPRNREKIHDLLTTFGGKKHLRRCILTAKKMCQAEKLQRPTIPNVTVVTIRREFQPSFVLVRLKLRFSAEEFLDVE